MKKIHLVFSILFILSIGTGLKAGAPPIPLAGTYTVGVSGTYTTITAAITSLNSNGVSGAVTFLLIDATYASETLPITLTTVTGMSAANNVTLKPNTGVSPTVSGSSTTAIFNFSNATYFVLDGSNSPGGTTKNWTISNTNTGGPTIKLINNAQYNSIKNCVIKGVSTISAGSVNSGIINFSTASAGGNSYDTISNCNITSGTTLSRVGIQSLGTSGQENSNVVIKNCYIFDYYSPTSTSAGLNIESGTTGWAITGNSFYQTASRTPTTAGVTYTSIRINNSTTGNGFAVSNNFIGGTSPNCGSTALVIGSTTIRNAFYGILLQGTLGTVSVSTFSGNTFSNIAYTSISDNFAGSGILIGGILNLASAGLVNITGNTIGSGSATGSITCTMSGSQTYSIEGIDYRTPLGGLIQNNIIGGITISGTASSICSLSGIISSGATGNLTVSGNTIGSASVANSINYSISGTRASLDLLYINASSGIDSIYNNTIANVIHSSTSTSSSNYVFCIGIYGGGTPVITSNTVRNISSASANNNTGVNDFVLGGIILSSSSTTAVCSNNSVNTLSLTNTGAITNIIAGISVNEGGANVVISKNRIYDLRNASTGTTATSPPGTAGILIQEPLTSVQVTNNQITLGSSQNTNTMLAGIWSQDNTNAYTLKGYFNSVFITGTVTSGALNTFSYLRGDNSGTALTNVTVDMMDNLLYNNRTGGTGNHYAIANQSTIANTSGWGTNCCNYQLLVTSNNNAVGLWGSTSKNFVEWRIASNCGASSFSEVSANVLASNLFTSPLTGDLSIITTNPEAWYVSGRGVQITGFNTDYYGNARSTTVAAGAPNIGSHEFDPASIAPNAISSGAINDGGTTTFSFAGRTIGSVVWHKGAGTLPTSLTLKHQTGVNPPATGYPSAKYGNLSWVFSATGGSGFTYDLTLNYDPALIGTITSEASISTAKTDDNGTTWIDFRGPGTVVNTANDIVTTNGVTTGYSIWTISDFSSPLPVMLSSFTESTNARNVILNWTTTEEINNKGFDVERTNVISGSSEVWKTLGFVNGNGTTNEMKNYTFEDKMLSKGTYKYRLKQIDYNGNFEYYNLSNLVSIGTPAQFDMSQNYPNPSNPVTKIDYKLPFNAKVSLKIYDIAGREVASLVNELQAANYYSVTFDGSNLSSGVYFYRINAEGNGQKYVRTMKLILVK